VRGYLRVVKGAAFAVLALTFALLAYESLGKLWSYQDSPSWLYITYGSVEAVLAVVCLTLAARSFRRARRR
jgi:hypothetical protein